MKGKSQGLWKSVEFVGALYFVHVFFFVFFAGLFAVPGALVAEQFDLLADPALRAAMEAFANGEPVRSFHMGYVLTMFLLPLDLAVLYHLSLQKKKTGNVTDAFDRALRDYPKYFLIVNAMIAVAFFAPFAFPIVALWLYRNSRGKIDAKGIIYVLALCAWGLVGHTINYEYPPETRRLFYVATLLLIPPAVYLFARDDEGHGYQNGDETGLR